MTTEINVLSRTQVIEVEPVSKSISVINAGPLGINGPPGVPGPPGPPGAPGDPVIAGYDTLIPFSTLDGATDSEKFSNFCIEQAANNFKASILWDVLRDITVTRPQLVFSGLSMVGGAFRALDQARSANTPLAPYSQKFRIRMAVDGPWATGTPYTGGTMAIPSCVSNAGTNYVCILAHTSSGTSEPGVGATWTTYWKQIGGWLMLPNGTTFGMYMQGMSFDGTAYTGNRVYQPNGAATIWTSVWRDISLQNIPGFLGSVGTNQPIDACTFGGWWNVNNITDAANGTAFHIGGSDCQIAPELMLIDSPIALMDGTGCLVRFQSLGKTSVEHLYITCERHMGIDISGGNTDQMLRISECEIEGRNAGLPSYGCVVRISMDVTLTDSWISFGMSNPSAANGGEVNNRGMIHIDDGMVTLDNLHYQPATGVAETVPFIYATTGCTFLMVSRIIGKDTATGGVHFKPVVKIPASWVSGTNYLIDSSVNIVTY